LDPQKKLCLQYLSLLDEFFWTGEILHKKSFKKDKADIIVKMENTAYLYRQEEVRVFRSESIHAIYYLECFDMFRSLMAGTLDWYLSKDKKPD
ncbi:MAG TPA: hypothetical protein VK941_01495, partial [Gillisia sp.]|nr:hypothetical protein [Gillisia sp.]